MKQTIEYLEYPKENREHKSSLFCKVFEEKKYLLDLYNSIHETDYQNEEDLEVNTLENVVYITMKNDLSFLIGCDMNLYEHQSTINPNMPLRGLLYFAQLYNKYIAQNNLNLFSSSAQQIPTPQYIVFYNGTQEQPDEQILLLSELFQQQHKRQHVEGCLECQARMLNINYGKNRELMEKCRRLEEYAIFVARVRQYATGDIENRVEAITRAIDECIAEGILSDILTEQKAEVLELALTTFNRELYEQGLREEGAREANEKIASLETQAQLLGAENKVLQKDKEVLQKDKEVLQKDKEVLQENNERMQVRIQELEVQLAQLTKKA